MPCRSSVPHPRTAFTLIELLVTVAIIAVLAAMLMVAVGMVRDSAKAVVCRANLRQLALACLGYADEHDGRIDMRGGDSHEGNGQSYVDILWGQGGYFDHKGILACPDAKAVAGVTVRTFNQGFTYSDYTAWSSYYLHTASYEPSAYPTAPAGPSADPAETRGTLRTVAQARAGDALLCEWSRILTTTQEPGSIGSHQNHWRGGTRPAFLHVAWFDGHVSQAKAGDLYPAYYWWAVSGSAAP